MKSLETIAADLAEYIESRQQFLSAAPKDSPVAMNTAQHLEVVRLMLRPARLVQMLDDNKQRAEPDTEVDLVGELERFYTALAHLGVVYGVHWRVQVRPQPEGGNDGTTTGG